MTPGIQSYGPLSDFSLVIPEMYFKGVSATMPESRKLLE